MDAMHTDLDSGLGEVKKFDTALTGMGKKMKQFQSSLNDKVDSDTFDNEIRFLTAYVEQLGDKEELKDFVPPKRANPEISTKDFNSLKELVPRMDELEQNHEVLSGSHTDFKNESRKHWKDKDKEIDEIVKGLNEQLVDLVGKMDDARTKVKQLDEARKAMILNQKLEPAKQEATIDPEELERIESKIKRVEKDVEKHEQSILEQL